MKRRDFSLDALKRTLEAGYGVDIWHLKPLGGHAHSLNFKVRCRNCRSFAAKCILAEDERMFARLLEHTKSVTAVDASVRLFDGRILAFGKWKVMALKWIRGTRRFPDELTSSETESFLRAHAAFLGGLVADGQVLPVRDGLALKRDLLARLKGGNAPELVRELKLMSDATLTLPPERVRIIHGDLHWENFRFDRGCVSGFLDIEELRFGTPAEDLVRYVVCRAEHLRWYALGRLRRLRAAFAEFVRRTSYTRGEWLFAIDGYLLRKLDKKIAGKKLSWTTRKNLAFRLGFYRTLRDIVDAALPHERPDGRTVVKVFGGTVARFMGTRTFDWGERYRFTCDPACRDYDWLCVYDEIADGYPGVAGGKLRVRCPKSRTMLLTQEPVSLKFYNASYVRQFGTLLTNRPPSAENHPGYRKGAGYMVWYTGRSFAAERDRTVSEKTKTLSAVYSAKRMTHTQHGNRYRFLELLKREIPGFDWYGKGVRPIADKFEVLDAYKYHLAFENHMGAGHWTEKLADALVAGCLPFYAGDPTVDEVLPAESFIRIPADDPERALAIVRKAIADGEYDKRKGAIARARELLLTRYNLFAQIVAAIEAAPADRGDGSCVLVTRHHTRLYPCAALSDLAHHIRRLFKRS